MGLPHGNGALIRFRDQKWDYIVLSMTFSMFFSYLQGWEPSTVSIISTLKNGQLSVIITCA